MVIKQNHKKYVSSKWKKTLVLINNVHLKKYIPDTKKVSYESLNEMLEKHSVVYVKPSRGSSGKGVMKIQKKIQHEKTIYEIQNDLNINYFYTYTTLYNDLNEHIKKSERLHIVQKGIDMVKYNDRSADIRVMVQQNLQSGWEVTGFLGRLSHPKKVVTNISGGGTVCDIDELLDHVCTNKNEKETLIEELNMVGVETAKQMNKAFPNIKENGIDIALDQKLHPWILEVNTKPDIIPFTLLKNKTIFEKILEYRKVNRRDYNPKQNHKNTKTTDKRRKRNVNKSKNKSNLKVQPNSFHEPKNATPNFAKKFKRFKKRKYSKRMI
ncbi:YheC/YheD family protein [Chengkuizengella sediminis]|uniref:YheC/YheD family protein n=1 Tax=Chengkuizengella sediminis TaxID=1885917 RepID=UPI0013896F43|nr:YheC/YheD family protein [Chengkuizengella sediminis]NDI34128.1 YheC/YheD family protein [Chengkuizengella sediminis]